MEPSKGQLAQPSTSQIAPGLPLSYLCVMTVFYLSVTLAIYSQGPQPLDLGVYLSAATSFFKTGSGWDATHLTAVAHERGFLPVGISVLGLWTPPLVFPILYPFALVHFEVAKILWLIFSISLVWLSLALLQSLYPQLTPRRLTTLAMMFPPILALFVWGQVSVLILVGFLLFLHFESRRWDLLAGTSLLLALIKPHAGFLVWVYLLIFVLAERRWKIAAGLAISLAAVFGVFGVLQPAWWEYYRASIEQPPLQYNASTLFGVIHKQLFPAHPTTQFAGVMIAVPLCLLIYVRIRPLVEPRQVFPVLLLLSMACAPYGWVYDQIVIFPFFALFSTQLLRRYNHTVVWLLLTTWALLYYALLLPEWGNNDWRPMFFPVSLIALLVLFKAKATSVST